MKPIKFKEATKVLTKPKDMTDKECSSLHIWNGDNKICVSCWIANLKERIQFLITGKIWLRVHSGITQPPVALGTGFPFEKNATDSKTKK